LQRCTLPLCQHTASGKGVPLMLHVQWQSHLRWHRLWIGAIGHWKGTWCLLAVCWHWQCLPRLLPLWVWPQPQFVFYSPTSLDCRQSSGRPWHEGRPTVDVWHHTCQAPNQYHGTGLSVGICHVRFGLAACNIGSVSRTSSVCSATTAKPSVTCSLERQSHDQAE
jgi:hypothetical protein